MVQGVKSDNSEFKKMRIAINTRFLLPHKMEGFGWYTFEIIKRMVEKHPEHTFLFFFDRKFDKRFLFGENVIPIVLNPPARHPLLFICWFEFAVYHALKKYKADVFFSPDGYLSLRSSVPQVGVIHDLNFVHHPHDLPWTSRIYYNYFFPKFARKATHLITVSGYTKQDLIDTYCVPQEKITVTWNAASEKFQPLEKHLQKDIQNQFASGRSYFLFVGSIHPRKNVKRLLEGYLSYLQTDDTFDLVVVGEPMWKHNQELISLKHDKIHFTGHLSLEVLSQVMGAASCFVFVPYFEGFGIPLVEAMQSGIPIIAGNRTSLPEVAGDAALYVDPYSVEEITQAMVRMAQDEGLREELAQKGLDRARNFSWDESADKVWEVLRLCSV